MAALLLSGEIIWRDRLEFGEMKIIGTMTGFIVSLQLLDTLVLSGQALVAAPRRSPPRQT